MQFVLYKLRFTLVRRDNVQNTLISSITCENCTLITIKVQNFFKSTMCNVIGIASIKLTYFFRALQLDSKTIVIQRI